MRSVQLAPLVAEVAAHPITNATRPAGSALRQNSNVETQAQVDVPETQRGDRQEDQDHTRIKERAAQINRLLVDLRCPRGPPQNVVPAEQQNHEQQNERNRQKRDVPLEEPND